MYRAEATASGVTAISSGNRSLAVEATGWQPDGDGASATELPDTTVDTAGGVATELRFPPGTVTVETASGETAGPLSGGVRTLVDGERHVVSVESTVTVHATFDGGATLDATGPAARLTFDGRTAVTVGVSGRRTAPLGRVVVPETPAGVATALSTLSAAHLTTSPDRSRPELRGRPPLVAFGEETEVPAAVDRRQTETDVVVRVPPDLRYLFTVAPLTHYVGATVRVVEDEPPRLTAPGVEHALGTMPSFQYEAAQLLRRVFFFDCLVRSRLPNNEEIAQSHLLDRLALDADTLAAAPPGERLAAYLEAPFELVAPDLPDWHLSMYLEPTYDHVRTLPHVLGNLPNVFLPETRPLDGGERLTRSLDDFYRSPMSSDVSTVDPVKPLLGPGQAHGWLADGVPIDVFKSLPEAYENRRESATESASVAVVLNDAGMADEHDHAADIYRRGTADLDIAVDVRSHLSREELAAVFERDHEMIHYIGHCEAAGLRCPDGHLSTGSLARSGAETFFLNACGSYFEGLELVRKGSVAGAVTFERVLDAHAARVGTTFVRLLVDGFSIERALELARRRIIMGSDYAVIGDGTHRLSGAAERVPVVASIERGDHGGYRVTFDSSSPRTTGDVYQPPEVVDERAHLTGSRVTTTVSTGDIDAFLDALEVPVVFDGDLQWADDLRGAL